MRCAGSTRLTEILFVGAQGRMEMERVPEAGYKITGLPVEGLKRRFTLENITVLQKFISSLSAAKKLLKEFRPDVVAGFGGYASGPVLWQAGRMGIPILIQEQNSYAGLTNKFLSRMASRICVAYEGMEKYFPSGKILLTGNPVRSDLENIEALRSEAFKYFELQEGIPVILILGGSLGAGSINHSLSLDIEKLGKSGCQWLWQTGKYYFDGLSEQVAGSGYGNIRIQGFISRMDYAFSAADIIVTRAGAGTISELCLAGKPAILVPSPNVAEDHQTMNAKALSERGAAILLPDRQAKETLADEALKLISDLGKRSELAANISMLAERNSAMRIAGEIMKLTER